MAAMFVILSLLFLPLLAFRMPQPQPYQITKLNQNAGTYLNELGTGHVIETDWKIVVYYNMVGYWQTYNYCIKG
jgi:hypothetical protein